MSDQSDSQNNLSDAFMIESEPSSPLSANKSPSSNFNLSGRRPRLLADISLTSEKQIIHRSKFLNDLATPKEHNLTMRYFAASQSGDRKTLRELRHQIPARRTIRHPPPDVVSDLDVAPLREHACLDNSADAGFEVSANFYECLREFVGPNSPIIDLRNDNDFIATVTAGQESVYQRQPVPASLEACVTEDANDTVDANVGISVPLFKRVVGRVLGLMSGDLPSLMKWRMILLTGQVLTPFGYLKILVLVL